MEQMFREVEAVVEGGIHAMRLPWAYHSQEEDWEILLVNAQNAFNEENWKSMMWAVWNEWLSGSQFNRNCYRH